MITAKAGLAAIAATVALSILPINKMSAQNPPKPPKLGQPTQLLGLQNRSAEPIVEAQATVTGSSQPVSFVTNGPIQPNMGQSVYVPPGSCITRISATLKSGKQLHTDDVNECRKNLIVVDENRIELTSGESTNPPTIDLKRGQVLSR